MRSVLYFATQGRQRGKTPSNRIPDHATSDKHEQRLREDHAKEQLTREISACGAVFGNLYRNEALYPSRIRGSCSATMRTGRPWYSSSK